MRTIAPLVLLPLAVAACAGTAPPSQTATPVAAGGAPFAQALAGEYRQFAQSEYLQLDWPDQSRFKEKADQSARGQIPPPEDPTRLGVGTGIQLHPDIDIGKEQRAEAIQGRQRLLTAIQGGAAERNPQTAARAQVAYDCWVEQLEEGWQRDDISRCRTAFTTAMSQLEARPVAQAPAPPPGAELYQVYFPFDSAALTPAGRQAVAQAAQDIRREAPAQIEVTGHADRAGSDAYNQQLSAARAEAVKGVLVAEGVPADRIRTDARGEGEPLVPTPDNVPQPENRRTVIEFD